MASCGLNAPVMCLTTRGCAEEYRREIAEAAFLRGRQRGGEKTLKEEE